MPQRAQKTYSIDGYTVMCMGCASPTEQRPDGRPRLYCSPACRQRAYRARLAENR